MRLIGLAVAVVSEAGGEFAGLTVAEAAKKGGITYVTARQQLDAGDLPVRKPYQPRLGPRTKAAVDWRQKYLPRALWAVSEEEAAAKIGISVSRMGYCVAKDLAPAETRRATGPRTSRARRWVHRFVPKGMQSAPIGEIDGHYQVSAATLHSWIRRGVAPKAGGYRTGKRPITRKKQAQKAAQKLTPLLSKAKRNPLAFAMGVS